MKITLSTIIDNINSSSKLLDLSHFNVTKAQIEKLLYRIQETGFKAEILWGVLPPRCKKLVKEIESTINNNITKQTLHPNVFTHILLSLHAYEDINFDQKSVTFTNNHQYDHYLFSWEIAEIMDDASSGYFGIIYQNKINQQLVLAHRGTRIEGENIAQKIANLFFCKDSDLQTDIKGIFGKNLVSQQLKAYEFTKLAVKMAKQKSYPLSIVGHSLGAWQSEMGGYYCHRDFDYPNVKIVNFDSPGSVAHMSDFEVNIKNCETDFDIKNIDITTYLSAPNLVNSCNQHLGTAYRLFPEIINLDKIDQNYLKWLYRIPLIGQKIKDNDFILEGLLSLSGHSLERLISCFDPNTGKPLKYMKVLHWPTIHYTPKQNYTDLIIENISQKIPTVILSSCFKTVAKGLVHKYTYSTVIISTINILAHFVNGEIDLKQYLSIYKHSAFAPEKISQEHILNNSRFSLLYKNHYHVVEIDHLREVVNPANKGSTDWLLIRLSKLSIRKIKRNCQRTLAPSVILLKKQFKIIAENGKKYIVSLNHDNTIQDIKDKMDYLRHSYPEVKEILQ